MIFSSIQRMLAAVVASIALLAVILSSAGAAEPLETQQLSQSDCILEFFDLIEAPEAPDGAVISAWLTGCVDPVLPEPDSAQTVDGECTPAPDHPCDPPSPPGEPSPPDDGEPGLPSEPLPPSEPGVPGEPLPPSEPSEPGVPGEPTPPMDPEESEPGTGPLTDPEDQDPGDSNGEQGDEDDQGGSGGPKKPGDANGDGLLSWQECLKYMSANPQNFSPLYVTLYCIDQSDFDETDTPPKQSDEPSVPRAPFDIRNDLGMPDIPGKIGDWLKRTTQSLTESMTDAYDSAEGTVKDVQDAVGGEVVLLDPAAGLGAGALGDMKKKLLTEAGKLQQLTALVVVSACNGTFENWGGVDVDAPGDLGYPYQHMPDLCDQVMGDPGKYPGVLCTFTHTFIGDPNGTPSSPEPNKKLYLVKVQCTLPAP